VKLNSGFWRKDWFLGVCVVLAVALFNFSSELIPSLEFKAYDMAVQMSSRLPSNRIAIIAIDDQSINNLGRWPWPREIHAQMTDKLAAAKAKVITNATFFFEPQKDAGLDYITKLQDSLKKARDSNPALQAAPELTQFDSILTEAGVKLNTDARLADSFGKAGNVLLPIQLIPGEPNGRPDKPLPDYVAKSGLNGQKAPPTQAFQVPIVEFGNKINGVGHLANERDGDGRLRTEVLALSFYEKTLPSLALMTAARSLNLEPQDIKIEEDRVKLGKLKITTTEARMLTYFYKGKDEKPAFQEDSFYEVLSGKIPVAKYADKIVLIGATANGVGTTSPTPIAGNMAPVQILAHTVSSILSEHFFVHPYWSGMVSLLICLVLATYLIILLPRLSAGKAAIITASLLAALIVTEFSLLLGSGLWLQLMLPATLLLIGHACLTTKRFLVTEAGKQKSDTESAESNRMLGLAFQGQGQLDMAFDKFRKCPLDDTLMDNLYNLALDFERKRQFNKAQSVYEYMGGHNPKFRDLEKKLQQAKTMSETIILGGGGAGRSNASMSLLDGGTEKPMLGRYQVEKELGKGAMGVVYLGKDPKIGRVVAIKTFAISQEFEGEEMQEAKERFFREAETAGRLAHPNIVTIYDAGEEQELCYIAMEFLKGHDLVPYTKMDALLAPKHVISIVIRVAEALAYAHRNGVVHRDIKPANIMYEAEADVVKVADFGIARITDSSKTKTGMVLGTPSYMSPEQLYGMKVDGRSDIFSLSVSMYLLLSGHLPFVGDSMGQLMFKIANEPTPDIRIVRPGVPAPLVAIIIKGMEKDIEKRYQTGDEMAADLRALVAGKPISAPPAPPLAAAPTASAAASSEQVNAPTVRVAASETGPAANAGLENGDAPPSAH
jgi:serine/threonine-protein kinase